MAILCQSRRFYDWTRIVNSRYSYTVWSKQVSFPSFLCGQKRQLKRVDLVKFWWLLLIRGVSVCLSLCLAGWQTVCLSVSLCLFQARVLGLKMLLAVIRVIIIFIHYSLDCKYFHFHLQGIARSFQKTDPIWPAPKKHSNGVSRWILFACSYSQLCAQELVCRGIYMKIHHSEWTRSLSLYLRSSFAFSAWSPRPSKLSSLFLLSPSVPLL